MLLEKGPDMSVEQVLTIFVVIATNLGTVLALYFQLDKKLEENRKETNTLLDQSKRETSAILDQSRKETSAILEAIRQEMKDFHGRLCAIEERKKMENLK